MKSAHAVKERPADVLQPPARPAPANSAARTDAGPAPTHEEEQAVARAIKSLVDALRG